MEQLPIKGGQDKVLSLRSIQRKTFRWQRPSESFAVFDVRVDVADPVGARI